MVATLHHIMIIDQQNVGIYFLMTHVLQQLHRELQSISYFEDLFSFSSDMFT